MNKHNTKYFKRNTKRKEEHFQIQKKIFSKDKEFEKR